MSREDLLPNQFRLRPDTIRFKSNDLPGQFSVTMINDSGRRYAYKFKVSPNSDRIYGVDSTGIGFVDRHSQKDFRFRVKKGERYSGWHLGCHMNEVGLDITVSFFYLFRMGLDKGLRPKMVGTLFYQFTRIGSYEYFDKFSYSHAVVAEHTVLATWLCPL